MISVPPSDLQVSTDSKAESSTRSHGLQYRTRRATEPVPPQPGGPGRRAALTMSTHHRPPKYHRPRTTKLKEPRITAARLSPPAAGAAAPAGRSQSRARASESDLARSRLLRCGGTRSPRSDPTDGAASGGLLGFAPEAGPRCTALGAAIDGFAPGAGMRPGKPHGRRTRQEQLLGSQAGLISRLRDTAAQARPGPGRGPESQ